MAPVGCSTTRDRSADRGGSSDRTRRQEARDAENDGDSTIASGIRLTAVDSTPRHHEPPGGSDPHRSRTVVAYLVVVFSPLILFFAFGMIPVFHGYSVPKENCGTVGCHLSAWDEALIYAVVVGIPAAAVQIALGCGVLALLRLWKRYRRLPIAVQGLIPSAPIILLALRVLFSSP